MEIKSHLKFKTILTDEDERTLIEIQNKIEISSVTPIRTKAYIASLLDIIQRGLAVDNVEFIDKVFFDFYVIRVSTEPHLKRIYQQLKEIGNFNEDSLEEQTHLVNLYRSIVADAFDPYLNLIVATLQFIEGTFADIQQTNLSFGERNKYEYTFSKLKPTSLFDGYNPIVRNAVSHAGTEGIIYESGKIVFREIKRGIPPTIKYEAWTNQVLREKILQLMDFIHAVDNCIEIVGFDTSDIIKTNRNLSNKFFDEILTREYRREIHDDLEGQIHRIINDKSLDYKTKLTVLNSIFSSECKKRNIPIHSLAFDNEKKLVRIEVPFSPTDLNIDNEIISKAFKLLQYGIIAVLLYKFYYENFLITELQMVGEDFISVEVKSKDLESYVKEDIGLYDLLNDSDIYITRKKIDVTVNFEKLQEMEYLSTDRRFPRKSR